MLAGALESLSHGLVMLSLANCGLSSRTAAQLSSAMIKNSHFATSLNKLVCVGMCVLMWAVCGCVHLSLTRGMYHEAIFSITSLVGGS